MYREHKVSSINTCCTLIQLMLNPDVLLIFDKISQVAIFSLIPIYLLHIIIFIQIYIPLVTRSRIKSFPYDLGYQVVRLKYGTDQVGPGSILISYYK